MSDKIIVSVGFGKENWKENGCSIATFLVTPPWVRDFPSKKRKRRGMTQQYPASAYPEVNGTLFLDTVEAEPGDIFMVQTSRTWRGARSADGAVFFRVRENGPVVQAHVHLPPSTEGRLNNSRHTVFSGKADQLDGEDLQELGFDIPKGWWEAFTSPEEIKELFEVESHGGTPKPEFTRLRTSSGDTKVITVERSRRRIRIR